MSAPPAAEPEPQHQTSETLHEEAQAPTEAVHAEPQAAPQAQSHTETQTEEETPIEAEETPIQAEGDIAIDDSTSAYSDEM